MEEKIEPEIYLVSFDIKILYTLCFKIAERKVSEDEFLMDGTVLSVHLITHFLESASKTAISKKETGSSFKIMYC